MLLLGQSSDWRMEDQHWEKGYRFQISRLGQREPVETIRLDSPVANRLSVLLREFAEDSPGNKFSTRCGIVE